MTRLVLSAIALISGAAVAQAQADPYTVRGNVITSAMQPTIAIHVDTTLEYVGSQRFELYGVAQAEQHLFAQHAGGRVVRLLWVQLEEYLPSSNGRYDYSSSPLVRASGRAFHADKELWNIPAAEQRPGSDGARARGLLRGHGLTLPPVMLYERLVWLPDSANRRELMVIYAEDLSSAGVSPADVQGSDAAARRLSRLLEGLQSRAFSSFAVTP
jgi:hypothetical protein